MEMKEPGEALVDTTFGPEHFRSQILSDRLALLSLALFVIFAAIALAALLPLQLLNPIWQLKSIAVLLDSAAFPLLVI